MIIRSYYHSIMKPKWLKSFLAENQAEKSSVPFLPFTKDRRVKINELQAITFDEESASDAQRLLAPPKRQLF